MNNTSPETGNSPVSTRLRELADPATAHFLQRYFKTGPGQYAEHDRFMGIRVPVLRKLSREYKDLGRDELAALLEGSYHEERMVGLFILRLQFENALVRWRKLLSDSSPSDNPRVIDAYRTANDSVLLYLEHLSGVNNWDLVDSSAFQILGRWLVETEAPTDILSHLLEQGLESENIWPVRIAVISTFAMIREHNFQPTLDYSTRLLSHQHDLIHKACGWMLREVGKHDETVLTEYLDAHAHQMPRTMLRYAIENYSPDQRADFRSRRTGK